MRKILFIALLFVCVGANAQRVDKPGEPYDYYCIITDNDVIIINGETLLFLDDKEEVIDFKGIEHIITYMSKRGWVLVSTQQSQTYHWRAVMKKQVKSDEEAMMHLKLAPCNYKAPKKKKD